MYHKVQCILGNDSGLDEDAAINTFHFGSNSFGDPDDERTDIDTRLRAFYAVVDEYLSENVLSTDGLRIKIYDHADAPPRIPLLDTIGDLTPGTSQFPNEVAVAISYRKTPTSGANRRRERGRIFLGPLSNVSTTDIAGDLTPGNSMRTNLANAAFDLITWTGGTSGSEFKWAVFSRSDALGLAVGEAGPADEPHYTGGQLGDGYHYIDQVYVDNAYDTQRRRGKKATLRNFGA